MIAWWWIPVGIVALIILVFLFALFAMRHELHRYLKMDAM